MKLRTLLSDAAGTFFMLATAAYFLVDSSVYMTSNSYTYDPETQITTFFREIHWSHRANWSTEVIVLGEGNLQCSEAGSSEYLREAEQGVATWQDTGGLSTCLQAEGADRLMIVTRQALFLGVIPLRPDKTTTILPGYYKEGDDRSGG